MVEGKLVWAGFLHGWTWGDEDVLVDVVVGDRNGVQSDCGVLLGDVGGC